MNRTLRQKLSDFNFEFELEADTISRKTVLTTSNPIRFNSALNKVLGFLNTDYPEGTHKSEKPILITSIDKVHLKCDCVDGPIVNGNREQTLFSF